MIIKEAYLDITLKIATNHQLLKNYSILFLNSWFSCLQIAGFSCHAIENKQTKPFISLSPEPGKRPLPSFRLI